MSIVVIGIRTLNEGSYAIVIRTNNFLMIEVYSGLLALHLQKIKTPLVSTLSALCIIDHVTCVQSDPLDLRKALLWNCASNTC